MGIPAFMDPLLAADLPLAGQAGSDTAAIDATPLVLLGVQSTGSLGLPSPIGLSYDELARHHARVCALRKPELMAECH